MVGPRPVGVAVDHAHLMFTVSFKYSTAPLTPQTSMRTRYTFTSETDSVYTDGMHRCLLAEEPRCLLGELTQILIETLHGATVEACQLLQLEHTLLEEYAPK